MTLIQRLQAQPSVIYRRDPWFYFKYDGAWLVGLAAVAALLGVAWSDGFRGVVDFQPWMLALLPLTIYLHVAANASIHNAAHGNFPRTINRVVGELLGWVVISRYASWEIPHVRHHKHSDDTDKDPHYVIPNFWKFYFMTMMVNVEKQLQNIRYDLYGDTPKQRRIEFGRMMFSFAVMGVLNLGVLLALGWKAYLFLYLPTQLVGWTVLAHFNWITHDAKNPDGDYKPVNLDSGVYWVGNRIWFGMYMHGNHHKRANIFNPLKMDEVLAKRKAKREAQAQQAAVADEARAA